ncbi:MAG: hypothetical protein ACPGNV_06400 [Mangrovicoccus sp.]
MADALTAEEQSKDRFFQEIAKVAEDMVEEHGKDFAAGVLVLAARWVAENRISSPAEAKH